MKSTKKTKRSPISSAQQRAENDRGDGVSLTGSTVQDEGALLASVVALPVAPERSTKKPSYQDRMRQLSALVRLRLKVESNAKRFGNIAKEVNRWTNAPHLRDAAHTIDAALGAMVANLASLPEDFEPARARKTGLRQPAVGALVNLRPRYASAYDGILDPSEHDALEVIATSRVHVSVRMVGGSRIVLSRAHVELSASRALGESADAQINQALE